MSLKPNNEDIRCFVSCDMETVKRGGCACRNRVSGNYTKDRFAISSLNPEKDWTDDFKYENGNYFCTCIHCEAVFCGHKRRVVCKLCAIENKEKSVKLTEEEYETVIKMFGVFIIGKVMDAYKNKENITIIIDDEFENYKQKYLNNGSSTN